ncbi:MAG: TetR/AcrR family transcriptional regulator [Pseudomonadota bacterium]
MGFPIEKHKHAIEVATDLFWREGFEGVSVEDVVRASGLNRYALYQNFGGKKGLFLAALEAYCEMGKRMTLELLGDPSLKALDALQQSMEQKLSDPTMSRSGCLMTTTAVELAAKDAVVAERVQAHVSEMKGLLVAALSRAQAEGDVAVDSDPTALAEILFNTFVGTAVQARMGIPQQAILASVRGSFFSIRHKS